MPMVAAPMTEEMVGRRLRQVRAALQSRASTAWLIGWLWKSAAPSYSFFRAARAAWHAPTGTAPTRPMQADMAPASEMP